MTTKPFDNKIRPLFSDKKSTAQNSITIIDDDIAYTEQKEEIEQCIIDAGTLSENITDINYQRYDNHPNIVKIKENVQLKEKFKI